MRISRLVGCAALMIAAGCSSYNPLKWAGIIKDPENTPSPLTPVGSSVKVHSIWTATVGKATVYALRPAIAGGRLYAASAEGVITVLQEDNGKPVASYDTKKPISGGVETDGSHLVVGTQKGEVLLLDMQGKVLWTALAGGEVLAPPTLTPLSVIVRIGDGRILAYSLADGKRRWVYQRTAPPLTLRSSAGVIPFNTDVIAGYAGGKLLALDTADGKLTWEVTVSYPHGATDLERIADIAGMPVINEASVCAATFHGKVACFDLSTRDLLWAREISSTSDLAVDEHNLYVEDDTGAIQALDKKTGSSVWKTDKLKYRRLTSPVVFDGRIVVGDYEGYIHVFSPDDGAIVGRMATDKTAIVSLTAGLSALFAQTAGGQVVAIRY